MATASEFEQRIRAVGNRIAEIREKRARAEATMEELGRRRGELIDQAKGLGVEGLDDEGVDPVAKIREAAGKLERKTEKELVALEKELGL